VAAPIAFLESAAATPPIERHRLKHCFIGVRVFHHQSINEVMVSVGSSHQRLGGSIGP